ncbi:MAG: hypothetical protein IJC52_04405 [Clostridia bacterium]|nr:hypothetical protein [Clostridia bacterium]
MFWNKKEAYEISEEEFEELTEDRDDTVFLDYDEHTGVITENGIALDYEDESFIGRTFIDDLIDSKKEIAWGRDEDTDTNYEFTRWNSKG